MRRVRVFFAGFTLVMALSGCAAGLSAGRATDQVSHANHVYLLDQ